MLLLCAIFLSTELTLGNDIVLQSSERTAIHFEEGDILHYCCISVSNGFNNSRSNVKSVTIIYDGVYRDSIPNIPSYASSLSIGSRDTSINVDEILRDVQLDLDRVRSISIHGFKVNPSNVTFLRNCYTLENLELAGCWVDSLEMVLANIRSRNRWLNSIEIHSSRIKLLPSYNTLILSKNWYLGRNEIVKINPDSVPTGVYLMLSENPLDSASQAYVRMQDSLMGAPIKARLKEKRIKNKNTIDTLEAIRRSLPGRAW